jgi:hypothetical protein
VHERGVATELREITSRPNHFSFFISHFLFAIDGTAILGKVAHNRASRTLDFCLNKNDQMKNVK